MRWHQGNTAEPKSQTCNRLNLAAGAIQRQFSCWINDSSSVKTCDCQRQMRKLCLRGLSACGQQEDMIIEWLHHTFLNIQCEMGRYGAREGRRRSRTGEMWQNQGMCEKGGKQAVGRYLGHTGVFFLISCTICSMSATLDVQLLLFSWVNRLQWNYAATPYAEHAIILPKQQSDHSASLTSSLTNPQVFVVFFWILLQIGLRDWIRLTSHQ